MSSRNTKPHFPPPTFEDVPRLKLLNVPGARLPHVVTPGDPEGSVLCRRDLPDGCSEAGFLGPDTRACKGCLAAAAAVVTVKRPDPKTGERVEALRAPDHFKPEPAELVSKEFTQKVSAEQRPGLIWPADDDPPVEPGQIIGLTPNISITVYKVKKTKGGDWRGYYTVDDDRPTLIRRVPPMFEPPETDEFGDPIRHDETAVAAATFDGSYTQDPAQAVPSSAPEVDVEGRRVLSIKSRARGAARKRKEQPMKEAEADLRRLNSETKELAKRAVKMGVDPTIALAPIAKAIADAHAELNPEKAAAA